MRIFLAGATGVYGRALIPRLLERGDTVVAMARSVDRAAVSDPAIELVAGDLLRESAERLREMLRGCDAVAHLATALRPGATGAGGENTNAALRTDGTRRLIDAVLAAGVPHYVQQSIVMAYPDGGDGWLDERTPLDSAGERAGTAAPVVSMEEMVRALDRRVSSVILRGGAFVGPGTSQDAVLERLRTGTQTVPGDGSNWISPIHVEDMAEATARALHRTGGSATFNITDEPIRNGDYLDRLAAMLKVPTPPRDSATPTPRSFRCTNAAARAALGWEPTHGIWPILD